ncbi:MAG: DEAD/DEAH box helicase [Erysipelotrichaceae bacterium]
MTKFNELALSNEIIRAVEEMGFESATEIQAQAIPAILDGRDVLGRSHTGTGKTAAFGIPAIEMINVSERNVQCLIICPTRELVTQVATEMRKFSKYKEGVKIVPIYGGQDIERQIQLLKKGANIVVGTPGRVMDHLRRKTLKLQNAKKIILDEADEMLNMGFKEDIEEILKSMPAEKTYQTILFSATMPPAILRICDEFQENPANIEIKSAQRTIDTVEQIYFDIARGQKTNALRILLNHYNPELTMIFCNTKKMVDELTDELNLLDMKAIGLHGDMKQQNRTRVMEQFRSGNFPILIATDVAARGIDVDNINLVVNYDIPQDNEYYIHRIGRTGRAGKKGLAVTLSSGRKQKMWIKDIARYTKTAIKQSTLPSTEELLEKSRNEFITKVKELSLNGVTPETTEILTELMSDEVAMENIVAALISMTYKPEVLDANVVIAEEKETKRRAEFDATKLKISIGRSREVSPAHVVAAITEATNLPGSIIGKIDVRSHFTLVDVDSKHADKVLEIMGTTIIKGEEVSVVVDTKGSSSSSNRRSGSRSSDHPQRSSRFEGGRRGEGRYARERSSSSRRDGENRGGRGRRG